MTLKNAQAILEQAKKKKLSSKEKKERAIELAAEMLTAANQIQSHKEKKIQAQLARMMRDPQGKAFTTAMADQCFRSHSSKRIADQMVYLLNQFGIPKYLDLIKRLELGTFQLFGKPLSFIFAPLAIQAIRKDTSTVILPGERSALSSHMSKPRLEGVRLNLNHLGEAILGEKEAERRLQVYLQDLRESDIEYVSVKISTIFSQINVLAWDKTLSVLSDRLRQLYHTAMQHKFTRADGIQVPKFINLDMEEYRDLILTKDLFKKVLDETEFLNFSAGIVLQAYLPDAHLIQKELTEWAMERVARGGAPIKIRIVKGANLAMEQFEASLRGWAQAPYPSKSEVDANYKRMVDYGCHSKHAKAVHLGIGSHNLFDIAYAMLQRAENGVDKEVSFEMLEGMADHIRRVVQSLVGDILLYCPVATKEDFQSAVAYLIRRLDENTGPENFLRATFGLKPGTQEWNEQSHLFSKACDEMGEAYLGPRRHQDRFKKSETKSLSSPFENEADTDFSLPQNRKWAHEILNRWKVKDSEKIPLVIEGKEIHQKEPDGKGHDPSHPEKILYTYSMADWALVDKAIACAKQHAKKWGSTSVEHRCKLLIAAAEKMRESRADLIGVMIADGGKTVAEGDPEVSEAIDFAEYYARNRMKMEKCNDLRWEPRGTVLVTPPWNFPISIPAGGILAALVAGNTVIFKPAPEAVWSGWELVKTLWAAGIPKEVLQFINCPDDPVGSKLIADKRIDTVILTGATATAKLFLNIRPDLHLAAETGGKNAMIITDMADRDLAIKDLVQSAFGHSGQKCSAASLAILEAPVYDDPHFLQHLKDAVESLRFGSPWDPSSKVIPLIRPPHDALLRGLTFLEEGEEWLVKPHQDPRNPNLWSPGVKLGVKENSFMHQTELFGPVLGIMRAKNLNHAIRLANGTPYGLTSGIQSLDERELNRWLEKIEAGNCYVNRSITGAIVRRQPFGGCKNSSFGNGAKAGGPNYVAQFGKPSQNELPKEQCALSEEVNLLNNFLKIGNFSSEERGIWQASIGNYAFWAKRFSQDHDPSKIIGQDNLLRYRPLKGICFRIQKGDSLIDIFRVIAAVLSTKTPLEISWSHREISLNFQTGLKQKYPNLRFREEDFDKFAERVKRGKFKRILLLSAPPEELYQAAAVTATHLDIAPVLASGRFELLHYLHEIALSIDYHRYGNLGNREGELRTAIF